MNTHKTTRIMTIAALLAIVTAGAPLFAAGGKQDASSPMETKTVPESAPALAPALAPESAPESAPVHTVTTADFETVKVLDDGSGVSLKNYIGIARNVMLPAELEGLPVKEVFFSNISYYYDRTYDDIIFRISKENTTIRSVTIAEGFTAFDSMFQGCTSLASVTLPKGVTTIGNSAFKGCKSLTSLTIPDSVTEIGKEAFLGCTSLTSLTIPAGVTEIGKEAFKDCTNLKSVTLPAGLTAIGKSAFSGSGLESIVIPDGVTEIERETFKNCKNLTEVTMPKRLTKLSGQVVVKSDITSTYGDTTSTYSTYSGAFEGCSSLKRIVIPAGVTTLEGYAFKDCTALEEITFEGNITITVSHYVPVFVYDERSPYHWTPGSFTGCTNIKKLNAGPRVTKITGLDGIPGPSVGGLPLKEQAEIKAAWSAFMAKYK